MKKQKTILIISLLIFCGLFFAAIIFFGQTFFKESFTADIDFKKPVLANEDEKKFNSYLELPFLGGKFLEFNENKSEISLLYFDAEEMKTANKVFKTDEETIFSTIVFKFDKSKLLSKEEIQKLSMGRRIKVFYLAAENQDTIPLAKLIQIEALSK